MRIYVIAMASEAEAVLRGMKDQRRQMLWGREIVEGKIGGESAAVVIAGVGKVNAAAATQLAIDRYQPERIINLGVAGAIDLTMKVGEVYAISKVFQCDYDLSQLNPAPKGTPNEYETPWFYLEEVKSWPGAGLRTAICATGDSYDNRDPDLDFVRGTMGAQLRDMELGAIAHVCRRAGIGLAAAKAVSDVHAPGLPPPIEQYAANLTVAVEALGEVLMI